MKKRKVGLLILPSTVDRRYNNRRSVDNLPLYGFRYIISEIDNSRNQVEWVSPRKVDDYDAVLCSLHSYRDVVALSEIGSGHKARIIAGGPGVLNLKLLADYIDVGVLGRGEGLINALLEDGEALGVWQKRFDPEVNDVYHVRQLSEFVDYDDYHEESVGCRRHCAFCQYSWKHTFKTRSKKESYSSDLSDQEIELDKLKFGSKRYLYAGMDGLTEEIRRVVNKQITKEQVMFSLRQIYDAEHSSYTLRLYNIVNFPFAPDNDYSEFQECLNEADGESNKKLLIFMMNSPFMPEPLTPMEQERVIIKQHRREHFYFEGSSIQCIKTKESRSFLSAIEQTCVNRCDRARSATLLAMLRSSRYRNSGVLARYAMLKETIGTDLFGELDKPPLPFIASPKGLERAKDLYYERKVQYLDRTHSVLQRH